MKTFETDLGTAFNADCFEVMKLMPDGCVDMILADLPYGTTACKWDTVIPFEPMWKEFHRIAKPNAAIVLTGAEPFSSRLRLSSLESYKYDWKWVKNRPVGFVNAKLKPLKSYEDVMVFSRGKTANCNSNNMPYFPQGLVPCNVKGTKTGNSHGQNNYYRPSQDKGYTQEFTNYPTDILEVDETGVGKKFHPTQKPVTLFEYLIKTYTNEDDLVFDPTAGSLTTAVAAENLKRRWAVCEMLPEYFEKGVQRFK